MILAKKNYQKLGIFNINVMKGGHFFTSNYNVYLKYHTHGLYKI